MGPIDIVIIVVIGLCLGGAIGYIYKAKKSGKKCIGCPDSSSCEQKGRCKGCSGACSSCQSNKSGKK